MRDMCNVSFMGGKVCCWFVVVGCAIWSREMREAKIGRFY